MCKKHSLKKSLQITGRPLKSNEKGNSIFFKFSSRIEGDRFGGQQKGKEDIGAKGGIKERYKFTSGLTRDGLWPTVKLHVSFFCYANKLKRCFKKFLLFLYKLLDDF